MVMRRIILVILMMAFAVTAVAQSLGNDGGNDSFDASKVVLKALNLDRFEELQDDAIDAAMSMERYARLVAGLAALFFVCTHLWRDWAQGRPVDFYSMLRPVTIALLIMFFYVVPQFIEAVTKPLVGVTEVLNESALDEYNSCVNQFAEKFYLAKNDALDAENGDDSLITSAISGLIRIATILTNWLSFEGLQVSIRYLLNLVATYLLEGLSKAVVICLMVFSIIAKMILIIIGPLVFALSLFPFFHDSLRLWFCRYINLCLYIPICNIIGYCLKNMYINIFYKPALDVLNSGRMLSVFDVLNVGGLSLLFMVVGIIMYCMVPKLSGWILDGQGNGLIGSAVGNIAGVGARFAAGSAGSAFAASASGMVGK